VRIEIGIANQFFMKLPHIRRLRSNSSGGYNEYIDERHHSGDRAAGGERVLSRLGCRVGQASHERRLAGIGRARQHDLMVIEDNAQCFLGLIQGRIADPADERAVNDLRQKLAALDRLQCHLGIVPSHRTGEV
jgi:hypothetical protein